MNTSFHQLIDSEIIDDDMRLSLIELCKACKGSEELISSWVFEGVLEPIGQHPQEWRFSGLAVQRARLARTMAEDMEINESGIALALDLLDRIHLLEAKLTQIAQHE